jgi:DNA-binding GntR family transcriptional regulator
VGIDRDSSTPLYVQLAALLRAQIEDKAITTRLPSVKTLSQEHGVSHITAERALTILRDEGLITAVIGKGYYVAGT